MKKLIVAFSFLAMACGEKQPENNQAATNKETTVATTTPAKASTSNANVKTYKGKLNDKIEVQIQVLRIDNKLIGEVVYLNTKDKKPIKVAGYVFEEYMRFVEFDAKGDVTGVFDVQNDNGKLATEWSTPKNKSTYSFELKEVNAPVTINTSDVNTKNLAGTYAYNYGGGARGEVTVKQIKDNEYTIDFFSMTKTGGNIAQLDGVKAVVNGNSFTYEIPESDGCKFKVIFHDKFITVEYLSDVCNQGYFGHNASIANEYIKVK